MLVDCDRKQLLSNVSHFSQAGRYEQNIRITKKLYKRREFRTEGTSVADEDIIK